MSHGIETAEALLSRTAQACRSAADHLLSLQSREGYWWAELTADSTLEADYILLELWLHPPENGVWNPPIRPRIDKAAVVDSRPATA